MTPSQKVLDQQRELDDLIEAHINNAPRSLQVEPGPSEIGIPCDLRLGYKLLGHPEVADRPRRLPWKAWIGTNVHRGLEELLTLANMSRPSWSENGVDRYQLEQRVTVGQVDGTDISGNSDLYLDGVVWDWKIPGGTTLREYKRNGPGPQYEVQAHEYGLGWELRGYPVTDVAIYFLPRDQEWPQRFLWSAPYNRDLALERLARVDGIAKLTRALGPAALPLLKRRASWCQSCPWRLPGSQDVTRGCPGDPDALEQAASELSDLIA
ncbi:hypothetical protein E1295_47010 [Nonomuraea mesophila]|uniref:PD-(D/E)XK endonuclease-like domain-containing protein n=1 Tax=Nonomuraea mesophila TaxID=2530382 RepID=A0A4V6PFX6_9ACTN|nr:hypothetical protein [Nonomuraea mesophila]TDE20854.1 hypothetical protein E1295_47010 [Nonomuraea mesophila]